MIHKISVSEEKENNFGYYYHWINFVSKELRINYIQEILNGCDVWEHAFRCYYIDPLVSLDADRWGYT